MPAANVFYSSDLPTQGAEFQLEGPEAHHIATVRRMTVNEHLTLSDGKGNIAHCSIISIARDPKNQTSLLLLCHERTHVSAPIPHVTVVQALVKGDRTELALELATEAGADIIIPWQAERSIRKLEHKAHKIQQRWTDITIAASKQSRRAWFVQLEDLTSTIHLAERLTKYDCVLVLDESANEELPYAAITTAQSLMLIVGPEGGITDKELDIFMGLGAKRIRLGPTVFRSSTAATVALGAIGAITSRFAAAPITDPTETFTE